jgi:hypothetical protein
MERKKRRESNFANSEGSVVSLPEGLELHLSSLSKLEKTGHV